MQVTYNIDSLYRQAFPDLASKVLVRLEGGRDLALREADSALGNGFRPLAETDGVQPAQLDFSGINTSFRVQGDALSDLGTPIFHPIAFEGGQYQVYGTGAKQGQMVDDDFVGWDLPATTTAEFNRAKEVLKSSPGGGYGTVKEHMNLEDWEITIRGLIIDKQPNFFPEGQLRQLLRWEKIVDSIGVVGEMFTYLRIQRLIIESIHLGRIAGSPNVIPFQLNCISDESKETFLVLEKPAKQVVLPISHTDKYVRFVATGERTPRLN